MAVSSVRGRSADAGGTPMRRLGDRTSQSRAISAPAAQTLVLCMTSVLVAQMLTDPQTVANLIQDAAKEVSRLSLSVPPSAKMEGTDREAGRSMGVISRGFRRRREENPDLPPGQHLTRDFPVLSAGPTPRIPTDEWTFAVTSETGESRSWTWAELTALPSEQPTVDIHCVTSWSKLGTSWRGVSVDVILADLETSAPFVMAHSYGGYTTNVPVADLTGGKAWVVHEFEGRPLSPVHGGPARLLVPHLYFWKSAKWIRGLQLLEHDQPGFWEGLGYHMYGDPWKEQRYGGQ